MMTMMTGVSAATPGPNLVVNGSFENFAANNSKWSGWTGLTTLEGWSLEGAARANTNWFEPHSTGYGGVAAADGRAMLDLGTSPGNVTVSQKIDGLGIGALYRINFSIAEAASNNMVKVLFGGVDLGTFKGTGKTMTEFTIDVVAKSGSATLSFAEVGRIDNTGTYLDNVKLFKIGASDAEREAAARAAEAEAARMAAQKAAETVTVVETSKTSAELYAGKSVKEIVGTDGNDYIVSSESGAKIDGLKGFNTLSYMDQGGEKGVLVDAEKGYAENTFGAVDSFVNIQKVIGSYGDDKLYAANAGSVLDGGDGHDRLESRDGKSELFGGGGNDVLASGVKTGANLNGQGDTLVGGHGDDSMDGGNHLYTVVDYGQDGGKRAVSVDMAKGLVEDSWGTVDTLANIGIVKGTAQGDWMKGGAADIIFDGGAGDDILFGGQGLNELYGAAGNDVMTGGDRTNYFEGGQGDDTINLGQGYNVVAMYGTDGADVVNGFKATDSLRLYNGSQSVEELVKAASYHEHADGRDGLLFGFGDTKVFLAGVYELKAEQIQLVNL